MHVQNLIPGKRNSKITVLKTVYDIGPGGFIQDAEGKPLDIPDEHSSRLLAAKREWSQLDWDPSDPANQRRFKMPQAASSAALGRPARTRDDMAVEYGAKPVPKDRGGQREVTETDKDGNITKRIVDGGAPEALELSNLAKSDARQEAESQSRLVDPNTGVGLGEDHETGLTYASSVPNVDGSPAAAEAAPAGETGLLADDGSDAGQETFKGADGTEYFVPDDGDWPEPEEAMPREYLQQMADAYGAEHKPRTATKTLIKRINEQMFTEE